MQNYTLNEAVCNSAWEIVETTSLEQVNSMSVSFGDIILQFSCLFKNRGKLLLVSR